jgi:hypothetical protein
MKRALVFIAVAVAVALGACGADSDERSPAPPAGGQETTGPEATPTNGKPTVERKRYWRRWSGYVCSKPIEGRMRSGFQVVGGGYVPRRYWRELRDGDLGHVPKQWRHRARPARIFVPSGGAEARKFCRPSIIIEYRSVLDILRKPWVERLIARHSPRAAWVRALHHDYIHDKEYLARILPTFDADRVDCVIVVHSPERDVFFLEYAPRHEGHPDHRYVRLSAREFRTSLAAAPAADRAAFWDNLR